MVQVKMALCLEAIHKVASVDLYRVLYKKRTGVVYDSGILLGGKLTLETQ